MNTDTIQYIIAIIIILYTLFNVRFLKSEVRALVRQINKLEDKVRELTNNVNNKEK